MTGLLLFNSRPTPPTQLEIAISMGTNTTRENESDFDISNMNSKEEEEEEENVEGEVEDPIALLENKTQNMTAPRRLRKELTDLQSCSLKAFRDISADDDNLLRWTGLIVPENAPYNKGAFRIEINFPAEYPFKPPKILFKTKIYHPNIDDKGQVCLPIISTENWKPATRTDQVITALIGLINEPEPEHPLRADLAEEYLKDRKKYMKNAEEYTRKNGEKRPAD